MIINMITILQIIMYNDDNSVNVTLIKLSSYLIYQLLINHQWTSSYY